MRQCTRRLSHMKQSVLVLQQRRNRLGQPHAFELRLFYHDRRALVGQCLSIDSLMIVGCARERHEDGRLPGSCDLGNRTRA